MTQHRSIKLSLPKEPYTLDLGCGVIVTVEPMTTALYQTALKAATRRALSLMELKESSADLEVLLNADNHATYEGYAQLFFAEELAARAIIAWRGVETPAGEDPAPLTREWTDILMQMPTFGSSFIAQYCEGYNELVTEGNASALSPDGIGAGAENTAPNAASSVKPAPRGDGEETGAGAPMSN